MTSINKNTQPITNHNKKPYLLPRTNWKSLTLLGVVGLNAMHAIFHYLGSTQCTRNIYKTNGPCDEYLIDSAYHCLHCLISIYCIFQRRKGQSGMKKLCIYPVAIALANIYQILCTDLMMDVEGFHDDDGFVQHTSPALIFCHGFAGSLGVWWFLDSLELSFIWGTVFGLMSMPIVYSGYGMPATFALVSIDAFLYIFFSGDRLTVSQSVKYWSNVLPATIIRVGTKQC